MSESQEPVDPLVAERDVQCLEPHPPLAQDCLALVAVASAADIPAGVARLLPADVHLLTVELHDEGGTGRAPPGLQLTLSALGAANDEHPAACRGVTLHALLTPVAALALAHTGLLPGHATGALAQWPVDSNALRRLRQVLLPSTSLSLHQRLQGLALWLEAELAEGRVLVPDRVVALWHAVTDASFPDLAQACERVGLSWRALQREVRLWFGLSPEALQSCTRVQHAARLAWQGQAAGQIASALRLFDPLHLGRSVRRLTGLSLEAFLRSPGDDALTYALRQASGGRHVLTRHLSAESWDE